ncbi:MAG: hypothetical protein HUJ98_00155 [Bacteroidaceae bacterium]|nr:hypothetical protein [Bacteroidaceae bacterium]
MKKITLVLFAIATVFSGTRVSAQGKYGADSAECIKYLSYYVEYYKQKNYEEALPNWRKAYSLCPPTARENMLIQGSTLMQKEIGKAKDPSLRQARIDTLLMLQDQRAATYPKNKVTALNNKGLYIAQYIKDNEFAYNEYNKIIEENQEKTRPNLFILELNAAIGLYKEDKLGAEDVINSYQKSIALLEKCEASDDIAKAKSDLEGLFITSQVASCDNLIALFTPRYDAAPEDMNLVTNIVKMLGSTEGCQNNDLFLKAVTSMHRNEPSANSAYYLYKLHAAKDESETAVKYLEEALASSDISADKVADYQLELATYCVKNGMNAKGFEAAKKAAELSPANQGKAYYLIGTVWGSVSCGGNEVTSRAKYWVACDFLQKAKAADASLTDDCNKLIGAYSVYFPQKAEAFMYDIVDGQSYSVSCGGMHATTIVRTQK